uniref:Uncharacterized protein n=1 Tax=Panagrolaimus sp. PS1159 TaxID=55785 RepID=A0AC35FK58_9BILA
MRLNIFLLLFFVAVFIFETAAEQCKNAYGTYGPPNNKLIKPRDSGQYNRFYNDYTTYVIIRKDPITIWLKIPDPDTLDFFIKFKVMGEWKFADNLYIQLFGRSDDRCSFQHTETGQYGTSETKSMFIEYGACECDPYELYDDEEGSYMSYIPVKLWTDNIVYEVSFEQDGGSMEMYLDEEEAKKWNSQPQQPPHESSMKTPSKNGKELPFAAAQTNEFNCDDDGFPLWLLILVIILNIILAIILILLIVFAYRGTKKMKTVIAKKKKPKAAGVSKQGAPSPIPTTPTPNAAAATKDKKKIEKSTNRIIATTNLMQKEIT